MIRTSRAPVTTWSRRGGVDQPVARVVHRHLHQNLHLTPDAVPTMWRVPAVTAAHLCRRLSSRVERPGASHGGNVAVRRR